MSADCAHHILSAYQPLLTLDPQNVSKIGESVPIPRFEDAILSELLKGTVQLLQKQPVLLHLKAPIYLVGDIHGNIFDLLRIFLTAESPPNSRFLFLGDFVDRGQYSIEVVTLLFALQLVYPNHIFLIRGNHEFESVNRFYGFENECNTYYKGTKIYEEFNATFGYMPLAAIVNNKIFCVHGGLSPKLTSINQFEIIKRPIKSYDYEFVADLVWSDPSTEHSNFVENHRGTGVTFGSHAVNEFLRVFGFQHIVRAHQCVQFGVASFNGKTVYTVFSCSNYAEASGNRCGLMYVQADGNTQLFSLPPVDQMDRASCNMKMYTKADFEEVKQRIVSMTAVMTCSDLEHDGHIASLRSLKQTISVAPYFQPCRRMSAPVLPKLGNNSRI